MKEIYYKAKAWVFANPKTVYKYSMIVIIISFVFTTLQYFLFPTEFKAKSLVPSMYSQSDTYKSTEAKKEKSIEIIMVEMKTLKDKHETKGLDEEDRIRLKYLNNKLEKIKYETAKN